MLKKTFYLFLVYFLLVGFNLLIAQQIVKKDRKIAFYKAIMNDLTEIGSALQNEEPSQNQEEILKEFATSDIRTANLKYFFRKYNSPLYDHAQTFVDFADKYQFDYRLLPAIAMQESNLCKYIYEGSYNCWGWGIYGSYKNLHRYICTDLIPA